MRHLLFVSLTAFLVMLPRSNAAETQSPEAHPAAAAAAEAMPLRLGGAGGLYLFAKPGPLVVEIAKQDMNKRKIETHLRAVLFDAGREVIQEEFLPDDGQAANTGPGPVQWCRLETVVEAAGVYGVNITVTNDRYGDHAYWGFTTNCPQYLVETSRGHRDAPHEEPIVVDSPEREGEICFLPRAEAFAIEMSGLSPESAPVQLYDASNALLAEIPVAEDGRASLEMPAAARENIPWRLHFAKYKAVVHIDGVTRWNSRSNNLSLWTPEPASWFPFHANRWLLSPYHRVVYAHPGEARSLTFRIHNNGTEPRSVALSLETEPAAASAFSLSELPDARVSLKPGEARELSLACRLPEDGGMHQCRLRATPEDGSGFTTYSTVTLRPGDAPAAAPLALPITLKPYQHENAQFGYLPDYPTANQVYFDPEDRPYVITDSALWTIRDQSWLALPLKTVDGATFVPRTTKVAFDSAGNVYFIGAMKEQAVYVRLQAAGTAFDLCPIPGGGSFDIEQFSGHNTPDGPPPFVRLVRTEKDPKLIWRSLNDLDLFLPQDDNGVLVVGEPVRVSQKCIGISGHSGIPSTLVSRGSKVHLVWGEATDPEEDVPGVPTFAATWDRDTSSLGEPVLIGHGPPANDSHNSPCITMDSEGVLHMLVGTHGRTFKYARSLEANNAQGGWTTAEDVGPDLRQTYVGLVCDEDDALHLVFRLWRTDTEYFPSGTYATLAHMVKRPGEGWSEPQVLITPPLSEYSIYYHRLTIDRKGTLFLSYDYWSTFWFYRTDRWGGRRALLMSPDGEVWKLAADADLMRSGPAL